MTTESPANDPAQEVKERVAREQAAIKAQLPDDDQPTEEITSEFIRKCYWRGETGYGELYAAVHRGKFLHNNTTGEWLIFDGHHWRIDDLNEHIPAIEQVIDLLWEEIKTIKKEKQELDPEDDKSDIKNLDSLIKGMRAKINKLYDLKGQAACIKAARTVQSPLAATSSVFDQHPRLLACKNCVVDLRTGKPRPGRPEDYLYLSTPIEYHGIVPSKEGRKIWDNTLYTMFEDWSMVNFLRRFFGYSATGLTIEQIFGVFSGGGRNGKRILIESVMNAMGQYAIPIKPELLLVQKIKRGAGGPTPELCALQKIRLAVASEVRANAEFDEAEVKRLSGSDKINVREPHAKRDSYQEQSHQLIIQVNDDPKCPGADIGFWERMIKVQFPFTFVKNRAPNPDEPMERAADIDLFDKLLSIYPHILGWIVEGAVEYHQVGLEPPPAVREAIKNYQADEDIIGRWIESACEKKLGAESGATDLYENFKAFYHATAGDKEPSQIWFGKQLKKRFPRITKSGYMYYLGIKLIGDPDKPVFCT